MDDSNEKNPKDSSISNVDVEMEVDATIVNKPDKIDDGNSTSTPSPKKKSNKKRKQKSMSPNSSHKKAKKDPNKPEYPKVGYVRYMYVRREELRKEFPDMHHLEVTKKIGEEWMTLDDEKKQPYLDAAKQDKTRYKMEMKEYNKKLNTYSSNGDAGTSKKKKKQKKQFSTSDTSFDDSPKKSKIKSPTPLQNGTSNDTKKLPNGTQNKQKSIQTPPPTPPQFDRTPIYGDIPIFTDQFLEHNRQMESELKKLRKHNTDYEQQNAVLEKHVENVRNGITKTNAEITDLHTENEKLNAYLGILRTKLSHQLRNLSIPSEPHGANMENIDKYMNDLYEMAKSDSHGPASLNKAKDLLRKVDLNIDLNAFHS